MKDGGTGGSTTLTGLNFENKVDLHKILGDAKDYKVEKSTQGAGSNVYFKGSLIARLFRKYNFYKFLYEKNIKWDSIVSKRLLPDDALLVIIRETLFIIEVKCQKVAGSVDEKLQTCDFKRKQYLKLVSPLSLKVEYVYVLNDWFEKPEYKDTLDYIHSVNCHYKFNKLPFSWLGLPDP